MLKNINRNELREISQPSKVILAIVKDKNNNRFNFLPICFNMYCGYNPESIAIAIHDINYSYELFKECEEFVLAIPTASLAQKVLQSGLISGKDIDKFKDFGFTQLNDKDSNCCGILECKVNIFCKKTSFMKISDHAIITGQVIKKLLETENNEDVLISFGPSEKGFKSLAKSGIHNLGVVKH